MRRAPPLPHAKLFHACCLFLCETVLHRAPLSPHCSHLLILISEQILSDGFPRKEHTTTPHLRPPQQVISCNNLGASLRGTRSSLRLHTTQRRRKIGRDASIEPLARVSNVSFSFIIQVLYSSFRAIMRFQSASAARLLPRF